MKSYTAKIALNRSTPIMSGPGKSHKNVQKVPKSTEKQASSLFQTVQSHPKMNLLTDPFLFWPGHISKKKFYWLVSGHLVWSGISLPGKPSLHWSPWWSARKSKITKVSFQLASLLLLDDERTVWKTLQPNCEGWVDEKPKFHKNSPKPDQICSPR